MFYNILWYSARTFFNSNYFQSRNNSPPPNRTSLLNSFHTAKIEKKLVFKKTSMEIKLPKSNPLIFPSRNLQLINNNNNYTNFILKASRRQCILSNLIHAIIFIKSPINKKLFKFCKKLCLWFLHHRKNEESYFELYAVL